MISSNSRNSGKIYHPLIAALCLASVACGSANNDTAATTPGTVQARITLVAPDDQPSSRTLDRSLYTATVTVDSTTVILDPNDTNTEWNGAFVLPADRAADMQVTWQHSGYLVARHSRMIGPVAGATELTLGPEVYETTGAEFDFDSDGASNLAELALNSNPDDAENIDVIIPTVVGAPGVNGSSGIVWESNPLVDWGGKELQIDNLMIDLGADRADGTAEFRWQAVHFDNKLYIIAYGESAGNNTPQADSDGVTRDDALNIYIDGDNSKGDSYDGVNDFHIAIAAYDILQPAVPTTGISVVKDDNGDVVRDAQGQIQVKGEGEPFFVAAAPFEPNSSAEDNGRVQRGANSLSLPPSLKYATGMPDNGQQVYELVIDFADLGIEIDKPFGLELQIDDDNDGGARDARYGWKHPSREDKDTNNTASKPSFMGTVKLAQ